MMKNFQREASLPGFRPGKAPRDMVVKRYEKDIQDEVKKKLIPDSYRKAIDEQKIDVVGYPDIEEIQFGKGQALQFAATIETAPDFELPEYKGLPAKRETTQVTDEDVERAINLLRERQTRPTKRWTAPRKPATWPWSITPARSDGKPLTEIAPTAQGSDGTKDFLDQHGKEFVHSRFCRPIDRREGRGKTHGERRFSCRLRHAATRQFEGRL